MQAPSSQPPPAGTNAVVALHLLLLVPFASFVLLSGFVTPGRLSLTWLWQAVCLGWLITWIAGSLALLPYSWRGRLRAGLFLMLAVIVYYGGLALPGLYEHFLNPPVVFALLDGSPDIPVFSMIGGDPRPTLLTIKLLVLLGMAATSGQLALLAWQRRHERRPEIDPVVAAILSRRPGGPGGA